MKCIVCGKTSWEYLFLARDRMLHIGGTFQEYRCRTCGLVRLAPQPSQDELKKYYPSKKYYSYKGTATFSFFGWLRSYLITHKLQLPFLKVPAIPMGAPGKILDIGCGSGDTLLLLKGIGWDVFGLDIDAGAIKAAHARGLKGVTLGRYDKLAEYRDNYFDVIRLYHVIEHLDDPAKCLALAYKKLKPGGEIIIGTPNAASLVAKLFRQYWYNLDCPRHLYLLAPRTLSTLVTRSKFRRRHVEFASAGGWVGSIQYILENVFAKRINLINRQWLVILFYPLELILDTLGLGDVMVIRAQKS